MGLQNFVFDQVFHLKQKSGQQMITLIPASVINVALNYYLIPRMGIEGAVLATLIASAIGMTMSFTLSRRLIAFPIPLMSITKIVAASAAMALVLVMWNFLPLDIVGMATRIVLGGAAFAVMAFAFNILECQSFIAKKFRRKK